MQSGQKAELHFMAWGYAPSISCFKLFLNEPKLIVDFRPRLFEFQITGRKKVGKFSRNFFFGKTCLKTVGSVWITEGCKKILKGVR